MFIAAECLPVLTKMLRAFQEGVEIKKEPSSTMLRQPAMAFSVLLTTLSVN